MRRAVHVITAIICGFACLDISHRWYMGEPADWFVWVAAIWFCALLTLRSINEAMPSAEV